MFELQSPPEAHYTVYKLTGPSGKVYIGQTGKKPELRWRDGYYRNSPMGRAVREYGLKVFKKEILCEKLTKEGADKLEKWFVEYYDSMDPEKGYNGREGGAQKNSKMNDAAKERDRQSTIQNYTVPGFAEKIQSAAKRVYEERPELRELVREQMKKRSAEGKNRAFIESSRKARPVVCIETGMSYSSGRAAERATGYSNIHKVCLGRQYLSGGYHWKFMDQ